MEIEELYFLTPVVLFWRCVHVLNLFEKSGKVPPIEHLKSVKHKLYYESQMNRPLLSSEVVN